MAGEKEVDFRIQGAENREQDQSFPEPGSFILSAKSEKRLKADRVSSNNRIRPNRQIGTKKLPARRTAAGNFILKVYLLPLKQVFSVRHPSIRGRTGCRELSPGIVLSIAHLPVHPVNEFQNSPATICNGAFKPYSRWPILQR